MYIGHFAVALGTKKFNPALKLGTLIFAAEFLDFLFSFLVLIWVEHLRILHDGSAFTRLDLYHYPISHSLLFSVFWSFLIGGIYFLRRKNKTGAVILGCVVFSHWILDFITHTPDLPVIPGMTPYVGLGLWNSTAGTIFIESVLFIIGIIFYFQATRAKDTLGRILPWTLILFLAVTYATIILSSPSSDLTSFAIGGLIQWLYIPWGYWIDRHRISA